MKKNLALLLGLLLSFSSISQYSRNLDGMSNKEIREFLLDQEGDQIQKHLKKYDTRKGVGSVLALSGFSFLIVKSISKKEHNPRDSFAAIEELANMVLGGLITLTGIVILSSSESQLDKAKEVYLITPSSSKSYYPKLRNDTEIYDSVYR